MLYSAAMRRLAALILSTVAAGILLCPAGCTRDRRKAPAEATIEEQAGLLTMLHVADPNASPQLVKGFYEVSYNAWRWTMQNFSVVLRPPANASTRGARLVLRLSVPEPVIQSLKSVTLAASVEGVALAAETYTQPGAHVYTRDVPPAALRKDAVTVEFALDRHMPPSQADQRELGIVVSVVGFEAK
jgi:hypothetical protein